jgi:thioredoxin-related protein
VFSQIHEIVFHGKGGYDWNTIYNMPIWMRRFTFEKIKEFYDKEREEAEKQQNKLSNKNSKGISRPNIAPASNSTKTPTYTVKAPKK